MPAPKKATPNGRRPLTTDYHQPEVKKFLAAGSPASTNTTAATEGEDGDVHSMTLQIPMPLYSWLTQAIAKRKGAKTKPSTYKGIVELSLWEWLTENYPDLQPEDFVKPASLG